MFLRLRWEKDFFEGLSRLEALYLGPEQTSRHITRDFSSASKEVAISKQANTENINTEPNRSNSSPLRYCQVLAVLYEQAGGWIMEGQAGRVCSLGLNISLTRDE
jgi:hypothetical protein